MPETKAHRLFLIDGYSNIFRAFFAIRNLSNSKGEPTNAVFGFLQILRKLLRDETPDLLGVALDVSRRTVRSEKFPEYKANRAPMPEELRPQIPYIRRLLTAYRIPMLELPNYEADDVLGTLARKARDEGYEVVIVSADKDLFQLVEPGVSMYHTGRNKLYDPAGVEEDFGVPPARVPDVLALMGDASDNVPGVKGIGEKGAKALIQEFGTLENLFAHVEGLPKKAQRENLLAGRHDAELSKDLVTIHTNLDLPFEPEQLKLDPPNQEALAELFAELEFFSLLEELKATGGKAEPSAPAREVETAAAWQAEAARVAAAGITVLAIGEGEPLGLALGGGDGAVWADFRHPELRPAVVASLEAWLREPGRRVFGHDLKEVLRLCPGADGAKAELFDTMLVSYVLRPSAKGHALEELALERLRLKLTSAAEAGWQKAAPPATGSAPLLAFVGERLALVERLAPELERDLGSGPLAEVYQRIEAPLVPVLVGMEERGVLLDRAYLAEMSAELEKEIDALEREIYQLAGEPFNLNSPQQMGVVLFEKLGYPVLKRTGKTKTYATGAEVLEQLAARGLALPERILRYRELSKLKSTYVDALPLLVAPDGRLHTRFHQAVAATGRLSSANPNLQNIPVRTELGQRIRKAFVAPPGHQLLVADYSQVELRILAHIAGEQTLLAAFRAGEDVHRATAAAVFGLEPGMVSSEQRRAAKTINFGILYGMSSFGLAANLGIGRAQAAEFINAYLSRYPRVKAYMDETIAVAEREGKVETLYGRVRWLPEILAKDRAVRENAQRMAINARIQGTAADVMKLAMIAVDHRLRREDLESRLLLTVHDELVLEVPDAELAVVEKLVREEMEGVRKLDAPLVAETGAGRTWYAAKG